MAQTSGYSKLGAFVICLKHGIERKGIRGMVRTSLPQTKAQARFGGCPICAREARHEK